VAEVAIWNHYGTDTIPARPFISATIAAKRAEIEALESRLVAGVFAGKLTEEKALGLLGAYIQREIVAQINTFFPPENAESTIRKKGSSKPLIDTKQLVGSIRYELR